MLQPHAPKPADINTARIIWLALTISILIYNFVLYHLGKITGFWLPTEEIAPLQKLGLISTMIVGLTFYLHSAKISAMKGIAERMTFYILVWVLHETMVMIAFGGTMLSDSGNGFFMVINSSLAILANVLMFPKEK